MTTVPIIIDTDPGLGEPGSVIDDGLAIALALASPELDVLGLTVVNGNVGALTGYALAHDLLERLGRADVPLRLGATDPLRQDMAHVREVFGSAEPTGTTSPPAGVTADAAQWLVEQVSAQPGEITLAAIGPLTNVAEAVRLDPGFASKVAEVVVMAGNGPAGAPGTGTDLPDFNIFVDPEAADLVLRSGAKIRSIGIDQTCRVRLTTQDVASLRARGSGDGVSAWLGDRVDAWIERESNGASHDREPFCLLHDPLVIATILRPELCEFADVEVAVDLGQGRLVQVTGESTDGIAKVSAAVDTDVAAVHTLILDRIAAL
ncbi:nucleoside hydrolase [Promicromonospora sp. CA-289599]|uniref:nucleoside hydrolase n=1 Tax=Promicromonospora sp. CA-289599 TaxID=3240014 RepID=UPI003D91F682